MNKKGIAVAGNMIVDMLYPINGFPKPGELTTITADAARSTGGCLCNDVMDLSLLDPDMPLTALGRVGQDAAGEFVLGRLRERKNIDLSQIKREGTTSFTFVMADELTKQRTFFHCRGANALFCEEDINWDALNADILHIGYILLLDALDAPDAEYGTKMARLLRSAKERGILTSIDVVTEAGERFKRIVSPALRYTDYCVINESEAQAVTGVPLTDGNGRIIRENVPAALRELKRLGVSRWAVIHCPEGGFGLDERGVFAEIKSLKLGKDYIKGTVGAGDAFCSGVLYGAWREMSLEESLKLGTAAAACSLSQPGATEGMRSCAEAMALYEKLR